MIDVSESDHKKFAYHEGAHGRPGVTDNGVRVSHCQQGKYVIVGRHAAGALEVSCPSCKAAPHHRCATRLVRGYHIVREDKAGQARQRQ